MFASMGYVCISIYAFLVSLVSMGNLLIKLDWVDQHLRHNYHWEENHKKEYLQDFLKFKKIKLELSSISRIIISMLQARATQDIKLVIMSSLATLSTYSAPLILTNPI